MDHRPGPANWEDPCGCSGVWLAPTPRWGQRRMMTNHCAEHSTEVAAAPAQWLKGEG